jgi:putative membrane protein
MEGPSIINKRNILILIYLMYAFAVFGHLYEPLYNYMLLLTPYTLFFMGALVIYKSAKTKELRTWLFITYVVTILLEIVGVITGVIFGEYTYGNVLGVKLGGVPLVVGLNWVIVIWGAILIAHRLTKNKFLIALLSAVIAVIFDILLEPVAIEFGYWSWSDISVPIQNYIAWFLIAFIFSYFYILRNIKPVSTVPIHYFIIQSVFFLVLNVFVIWA